MGGDAVLAFFSSLTIPSRTLRLRAFDRKARKEGPPRRAETAPRHIHAVVANDI
jgi:hypothetical protein